MTLPGGKNVCSWRIHAATVVNFGRQFRQLPIPGSVVNQWGTSSGPIHVHEAERSLDLIYENFRENKKLLLKKAGGVYFTERYAGLFHGMDKCDHGTERRVIPRNGQVWSRNGTQGYSTEWTSVITERNAGLFHGMDKCDHGTERRAIPQNGQVWSRNDYRIAGNFYAVQNFAFFVDGRYVWK